MGRYSTTVGQELETDPVPVRALGSGYLLLKQIGGGATGQVWRGVRRADGAAVAIKVLRPEFVKDTESVVRFLRQRTVLPAVHHQHLVHVHDLVAEGDVVAIVMDLVEGPDLRQVIRHEPLTQDHIVEILAQVAQALAAVHAAGVVHRDIKPDNVIIGWKDGQPHAMLTDFGLAKVLDSPVWTSASQLHGTPAYIAPEVVTGRGAGPAADVYGLAVMAYELLSGERPVKGENPAALLLAHLDAEVVRPSGISGATWRLLQAGLAKDPAARPTAAEFARRLKPGEFEAEELISQQPATESTLDALRPAPAAPKAPRKRRKRWILWTAAAVCVLLGVAGGLWYGRPEKQPVQPPGPAPVQYFLTVTAISPKPGEIRLVFPDAKGLPGFESYLVYRDRQPIDQLSGGSDLSYQYFTEDHATEYCFEIAALLLTENPPAAPVSKPACVSANGKPRE